MLSHLKKLLSIYARPGVIYILIPLFVLLATFYSVVVPPFEAPDEVGHFDYILHLRQAKQLPIQQAGALGAAQHPPLYYVIAALLSLPGDAADGTGRFRPNPEFMWSGNGGDDVNVAQHHSAETFPYQGQALILHLARLVSVLMGAGTVFLVYSIGKLIFPAHLEIAGLAATLVALNPQFIFISGVINNDNLLILAATGLCFHLLCAIGDQGSSRQWLYTGIWLSVATMAKVNGLLLAGVVGLFLAVRAWQQRSPGYFLRYGLIVGSTVALLTGWWFMRNMILYGDFLGWSIFAEIYSMVFRQAPLGANDLRHFFATQFNSFWGRFGWMNIWSPAWFYSWIRLLIGAAAPGLLIFAIRQRRTLSRLQITRLALLIFMVLLYEGYMLWAITKFDDSWYQGRYIFPIIAPLMLLMSIGILSWTAERFRAVLCLALFLAMTAIAIFMPLQVIGPAYSTVAQPKWRTWGLSNQTDYRFGESMLLRGYEVQTEEEQIVLHLYWQAVETPDFNYSAFVHLLDDNENILTQNDHAPGESDHYPPKVWKPGDIVIGKYVLEIANSPAPDIPRFRVGLYNWETGQRVNIQAGDEVLGDNVILSQ